MKKLCLLLVLAFLSTGSFAQMRFIEARSLEDYQTILKAARQKDRMLLLVLHNGQGAFRQMFFDGVFDSEDLQLALSPYRSIAIDLRDEMGAIFVENFALDSIPSFYFMDANETVLALSQGYQSSAQLAQQARRSAQNRHEYDSLLQDYAQGRLDQNKWQRLLALHALNFPFEKTARLAIEFFNSQTEEALWQPPLDSLLLRYGVDWETPYPKAILARRESLGKKLDFPRFFEKLYSYNLNMAIAGQDSLLLQSMISEILPLDPDQSTADWELPLATQKLFAEETGLFEFWARGAISATEAQSSREASGELLFENAFELTEAEDSEEARAAAQKMVQACLKYSDAFKVHALGAYLSYLQKDYPQARKEAQIAQQKAQNRQEEQSARRLLSMIEEEAAP